VQVRRDVTFNDHYSKFTAEFASERILKIGLHFVNL